MAVFKAFKPEAMNKIAKSMGYTGNMGEFQNYIEQDPARQARMEQFTNAAIQMAKGGVVKMREGGVAGGGGIDPLKSPFAVGNRPIEQSIGPAVDLMTGQQYGVGQDVTGNNPMIAVQTPPGYRGPTATMANMAGNRPGASLEQIEFLAGGNQGQFAPGTLASAQNQMQMSGNITGNLADAYDPRIIADGPGSRIPFTNEPQGVLGNQNPVYRGVGATSQTPQTTPPAAQTQEAAKNVQEATVQRMFQPGVPTGGVTQAAATSSEAGQYVDPRAGMVTGAVSVPTAMATTATAAPVQEQQAAQMEAAQAAPAVDAALAATQAAQGVVDPRAEVTAAQQTASSVGNLTEAQGNATLIDNPVQRNIQDGELITGSADAQTAATFTEQVQAAEATPSAQATVQGQLAQLTANFDATNPPAWAAGALRNATQQMAARGLGASSIAGQAIVQATIEAALPIAQADAAVTAQFEAQNLSNRQQRAMLAAQQRAQFIGQEFDQSFQARVQNSARIGDIANMNFTAEQQVQLENSRAANTMNLNNLSNSQAMVMAEASALAQMDAANLNNRQQSAVQNAQSFLQMDMANLSNQQQTELFKSQQTIQSLFTDQAATNAASQFNATSQNQVDQFFANLASQTSQFNAAQSNAQAQFNAGQANTVERFNAEMNNQRDQFNAQNQVVIAQSNAQWRRQIATADTAAVNRANELNAAAVLDISNTAYNNLWQYYADSMEHAWEAADSELDRLNNLAVAQLSADATKEAQAMASSSAAGSALGGLLGTLGSAFIQFG